MNEKSSSPGFEASNEVLFRYQVISQVKSFLLLGKSLKESVFLTASMMHLTVDLKQKMVSSRTVYRWIKTYDQKGISGLQNATREKDIVSKVLSVSFLDFLKQERDLDIEASIPELIKRAYEYGIVKPEEKIDRTTVYRAMKKLGIDVKRRKKQRDRDSHRFEYPHRMDMVLCDGKHFRAGIKRAKRVVLFFLDDYSRYGLHAVVGTSENTQLFMRGMYETIKQAGYMTLTYVDLGPGFKSKATIQVAQKLDIHLIHGEKAYPEGRGKIEKFNQTAKHAILRNLDGRPDVDASPGALELRLQYYLREVYNHNPHESLNRQTPYQRFHNDQKKLRFPENEDTLKKQFILYLKKKVSNDNVVSVNSVPYEMPSGYAKSWVTLYHRVLDGSIAFLKDGSFIELLPVDLVANARSKRVKKCKSDKKKASYPLPKSAAELKLDRFLSPVVGPDGGFPKK